MTEIFAMRHYPISTEFGELLIGQMDVPLKSDFPDQARETRDAISRLPIQRLFTSPLQRCVLTGKFLIPSGVPMITTPLLIERSLGTWEGQSRKHQSLLSQKAFTKSGNIEPLFRPPNGETAEDVVNRILLFLNCYAEQLEDALIVTHNGVLRALHHILERKSLEESWGLSFDYLYIVRFRTR